MSLRFTALKLEEGDAFLLQDKDGDRNYLFDSGGSLSTIEGLLKGCGVNKLDVAICSHNDKDHSRGLIGLLKSPSFTINEVWLPALWGSILCFIGENKDNKDLWSNIKGNIHYYFDEDDKDWKEFNIDKVYDKSEIPADKLKEQLTTITDIYDSYLSTSVITCAFIKFLNANKKTSMVKTLTNIIEIATLALKKGCEIVWFKNVDQWKAPFRYGFFPLNSEAVCIINYKGGTLPSGMSITGGAINPIKASYFTKATALTIVDRYSLVFEYYKDAIPVVRFSADSHCDCQTNNPYANSIIITAPHHGSDKNTNVFKNIKGSDIKWVRSYHRRVQVGCTEFLNRSNRYCVKCPSKVRLNEIKFEYKGGKWQRKSGLSCKC